MASGSRLEGSSLLVVVVVVVEYETLLSLSSELVNWFVRFAEFMKYNVGWIYWFLSICHLWQEIERHVRDKEQHMSPANVERNLYENTCKAWTYLLLRTVAAYLNQLPVTDRKWRSNMTSNFNCFTYRHRQYLTLYNVRSRDFSE